MEKLDKEQLKKRLKEDFSYWYHKIDLGDGVFTPGFDYGPLWDNIKKVMRDVDYKNKNVLDLGSFDGLWAFEAEKRGAETIIATDCLYRTFRNFLFCKEMLSSKCIPYYNVSPYNLFERLDVFFQENYDNEKPYDRLFDIVQHLGLLYHLRDPLLSLSQSRSCMKTGGTLIIESNVVTDSQESFMLYNGIPFTHRISENYSVWWAPTVNCLKEMLMASLFEPVEESISIVEFRLPLAGRSVKFTRKTHSGSPEKEHQIGRLCMIAKAIATEDTLSEFSRELLRTFRNPGMNICQTKS